jgi:hypothetical protein
MTMGGLSGPALILVLTFIALTSFRVARVELRQMLYTTTGEMSTTLSPVFPAAGVRQTDGP